MLFPSILIIKGGESMKEVINNWLKNDHDKIIKLTSDLIKSHNPSDIEDTRSSCKIVEQYLSSENISYTKLSKEEIMPNIVTSFNHKKIKVSCLMAI